MNEFETQVLSDASWRNSPARMANRLTGGRYKLYPHVKYLDRIIAPHILKGNARLIVSLPPRHGKSWLISKYTPAWYLSLFPTKNVLLASYEASFAASWGRQARNFIQEYEHELEISMSQDSQAADRWNTNDGGGMITAGVGGAITGRGGDLLIIDDPVKNWEEASSDTYLQRTIDWWGSTFYTRAEPGASIIILATRWTERDLSGYLLSEENENHKDWVEIKLPAIAEESDPLQRQVGEPLCPERFDNAALIDIKRSIGSRAWNALYQQRPSAQEGNIIKRDWLKFYMELPQKFDETIISVDATFTGKSTSDYVAIEVWGRIKSQKFWLDLRYEQLGITDTLKALVAMSRKWPTAALKLIENKANGPAIEDLLKKELSGIVLWEPQGDKVARLNAVAPQFEAGNVFFPHPSIAPWITPAIEEIVTVPNATHDDRTDAMTQALIRLEDSSNHQVGLMRVIRR